jgi:hypothetical protein
MNAMTHAPPRHTFGPYAGSSTLISSSSVVGSGVARSASDGSSNIFGSSGAGLGATYDTGITAGTNVAQPAIGNQA